MLKKTFSILLLGILLFNWAGYRLFISFAENKANEQMEAQLDSDNYEESNLISIKVPVENLSYCNNNLLFERTNGEIEINGVQCNFVKRRLYNDSIELLCIPNNTIAQLQKEKIDFLKSVNDVQQTEQGKKSGNHSNLSKNLSFDNYTVQDIFSLNDVLVAAAKKTFHFFAHATSYYPLLIENPPEPI